MKRFFLVSSFLLVLLLGFASSKGESKENGSTPGPGIPIFVYHRFGPVVSDSMTVTTDLFESHLRYIRNQGHRVISLREAVDYFLGQAAAPPPGSLVITADDGHRSVYAEMFPLLKRYRVPATLFIYPSAVSNASYAVTWAQLKEMKASGFIDLQSHTFWHPNFNREKAKLKPAEYGRFVDIQLRKSKQKLEREFHIKVDMLAWPFGIYDDALIKKAMDAGYIATFTIERHNSEAARIRALPRYLVTQSDRSAFERIMNVAAKRHSERKKEIGG